MSDQIVSKFQVCSMGGLQLIIKIYDRLITSSKEF